jgi:DNA primase
MTRHDGRDLVTSGVFSAGGYLKFYKHPLLFPFFENGMPVFLTSRRYTDEKPKYLSISGQIPCLYNVDALNDNRLVWLVEGVTDALTLLTERMTVAGVPGACNFRAEWAAQFRDRTVILALDPDEAGQSASAFISDLLSEAGAQIQYARVEGNDINSHYVHTGQIPNPLA